MAAHVTIVGSYLSPYVRKVLAVLSLKNIPYEIDPIIPFSGNEEFSKISPLRRIPVLIDHQITLADSSVICQYLEECYPEPSVYPRDLVKRAEARWLEEYADTRMGDVIIWQLYKQMVINPYVFGKKTDETVLKKTTEEDLPQILNYLESQILKSQVPSTGFFFGEEPTIADISVATFFRNALMARYSIDEARWPWTAGFIQRVLALPCFERLKIYEGKCFRTPMARHRDALAPLGAPLTIHTYSSI